MTNTNKDITNLVYSYENIISKISKSIDELFNLLNKHYNPYLFDFDKRDECYVISTCNNNIIKCRVSERMNKDEDKKFSYKVYPVPEFYKLSYISIIKFIISKKFNFNFKYPFPWNSVPYKTIAGVNMFKTSVEALHFLELRKNFQDLNETLKLSFIIQQKINPPEELTKYKTLTELLNKYRKKNE